MAAIITWVEDLEGYDMSAKAQLQGKSDLQISCSRQFNFLAGKLRQWYRTPSNSVYKCPGDILVSLLIINVNTRVSGGFHYLQRE